MEVAILRQWELIVKETAVLGGFLGCGGEHRLLVLSEWLISSIHGRREIVLFLFAIQGGDLVRTRHIVTGA